MSVVTCGLCLALPGKCLPEDSLRLEMIVDTTEYLFGQDIVAESHLINLTNRILRIYPASHPKVLRIIGGSGETLTDRWLHAGLPRTADLVPLSPFDTVTELRTICDYYYYFGEDRLDTSCLKVGTQDIRAVYFGQLMSDYVAIKVTRPTGFEEEAYDSLRETLRNFTAKEQWSKTADRLERYLERYGKSVYVPEAMKALLRLYAFKADSSKVMDISRRIIDKFPNHPFCEAALSNIVAWLPDSKRSEFLKEVAEGNPGTRLSRYAESLLKKR